MEWINFHVSNLDKVEFRTAEAGDRGTWLFLLRYCVGQEVGDRIPRCRSWSDQTWQKTCAVSSADVMRQCGLWEWDGEDLIVGFYPHDAEESVRKKRMAAINTNAKRHAKRDAQRGANETEQNGTEERENERILSPDSIPSEQEVRDWALGADVDSDYAVQKWNETSERHAWFPNKELLDWKKRFERYWQEDKDAWAAKKNPPGAVLNVSGTPPPPSKTSLDFSAMRA